MSSLFARRVRVIRKMPGLEVRFSTEEDGEYWAKWVIDPDVERFYPMGTEKERQESVKRMQAHCKYKASLTAVYKEKVAGIAYLNLHPFRKIAHHAIFTIIVDPHVRGLGIGRELLEHLERLGKESFRLEMMHLEVYEGNPAIRLYRRMGYRIFGFQSHWIREATGVYRGKVFMYKWLREGYEQ